MSVRPAILRSTRSLSRPRPEPCILCLFRSSPCVRRYATTKPSRRTKQSPQELRDDIDRRNRIGFLTMMKMEKMLTLEAIEADRLITDFLSAQKDNVDPATNAQVLAKKYKRRVGDITYIAIPLLRVPDVNDSKGQLPPSRHPAIAAQLLLACSAAKDSLATLQILAAVHLSHRGGVSQARDIARLFSAADINTCRKMLEQLAAEGDADAMTLQGQFLEDAGQKFQAKALYERALEKCETKYDPKSGYPHPMALPRTPPWIALSSLLLTEKTLEARTKAKVALEKGAFQADDPLAYYQLSLLEDGVTPDWLRYTNKAAASGHLEAAYKLGHFYMEVNSDPQAFQGTGSFRKALNFVTSWKSYSVAKLAREWFEVAAEGGHKAAMLELVELYGVDGLEEEKVRDYLSRMVEPPPLGKSEEWPQLVVQAKKRLADMKPATPIAA